LSETCLLNIAEPRVISFDLNIIISMLHFWHSSGISVSLCHIFPLLCKLSIDGFTRKPAQAVVKPPSTECVVPVAYVESSDNR
jgi:hypothetical protein